MIHDQHTTVELSCLVAIYDGLLRHDDNRGTAVDVTNRLKMLVLMVMKIMWLRRLLMPVLKPLWAADTVDLIQESKALPANLSKVVVIICLMNLRSH